MQPCRREKGSWLKFKGGKFKYQKMAIMFSKMAVLFIMGTSRKMIIIKNQAIDMHVQVIMVWYQCSLGEVLSPIRDMWVLCVCVSHSGYSFNLKETASRAQNFGKVFILCGN